MKFVIDAFGGDNAPKEIVRGAVTSVNLLEDVSLVLAGDEEKIKNELNEIGYNGDKIEILHAPEVIGFNESPTMAIRQKKNSSLVAGLSALKEREDLDAFISLGSTGAVLAGGLFIVGRMKGVLRPTLASIMPNSKGTKSLLIDCGANVDCKPEYLYQFAKMGVAYIKSQEKIENPSVALLSVGTEDHKGNALTLEAFKLLKEDASLNFVGNMEARDILSGNYDVIVCDGFAGNVALKSIEGAVKFLLGEIKSEIKNGSLFAKLGASMLKKSFKNIRRRLDYEAIGSPFIGVSKLVLKGHGSGNAKTIYSLVCQARELTINHTLNEIENSTKTIEGETDGNK
ncbi:MAG: phosphate acyltransferase PlsX [Clostridia bacterium]|nr:phosphate acyltransferase PlsX [Clostridia bacterium]